MIRLLICFLLLLSFDVYAKDNPKSINVWKKGVVSIKNKVIKSPYNPLGSFNGSGFIVDKKLGIVLTNKHVVNQTNINETYVILSNGRELEADVIYSDPLHDFSFLRIADLKGLEDSGELKLSNAFPKMNENVTIIGNNDSQSFSIQKGIVTSIFELSNYFPSQTVRISLNARGGSSGSPIISGNGDVIAINFAVDNTYSYALPASYLADALNYIKKGSLPMRRDLGVIFNYISIDSAKRFFNLSDQLVKKYQLDSPASHNKLIIVDSLMVDSTGNDKLQPGDIIAKLNGKSIGANLYELQHDIDGHKDVKVDFIRFGKELSTTLKTQDLNSHKITRMIEFGGALFYESDDFISLISGAETKQVFVSTIEPGGSFEAIPSAFDSKFPKVLLNIVGLNDKRINNLDELKSAILELKSKQNFITFYKNYYGRTGYNKSLFASRLLEYEEIQHSSYEGDALLYELDPNTSVWKTTKIRLD